MESRLKEVLWKTGVIICIGLLYAFIYMKTDLHIFCMFNKVTGLLCPGCGISAMCISILQLDFAQAFYYNGAIMLALPILILLTISILWNYIRLGNGRLVKWQRVLSWMLLVYFLGFGILRNL